jgi:hydrogenase expression/formation protein HypE
MSQHDHILLAHGGGGQLTAELVEQVILPALGGQDPAALTDAADMAWAGERVVFTTDSYVVQPLEFPGGDIGKLAVCGTINDLAVAAARPVALSMSLVLEEGLEIELLARVLASAGRAARAAGVAIVTGDTKVIDRRGEPGMTINTTGIGAPLVGSQVGFERVRAGDAIILTGPLGLHGLAVMCRRKGLSIASSLESDCQAIHELTAALVETLGHRAHWMRDPTRGGLAATLAELSRATGRNIEIHQRAIPTDPPATAAAEMLGLDLLTVANEGRLVAVAEAAAAEQAVTILAAHEAAPAPAVIGAVGEATEMPLVEMVTAAGGRRIVQMPYGEELPRIC